MLVRMKTIILASMLAAAPAFAFAAGPTALGPNAGQYGQWTAATYGQGSDKVCYAFTAPQSSTPAMQGRGKVMLTVSERKSASNEVSVTSGYDYPKNAKVQLTVGNSVFPLYTQRNVAFAADGKGAVTAFRIANAAVVTSSGPQGDVTDQFSLDGFSAAYHAIVAACR